MTSAEPAAPVLIQCEQRRLAARAVAEEPAARAEGRFLVLVLEMQRLMCGCIADALILRFAEAMPALHRGKPDVVADVQAAIHFSLDTLKADAIRTAAEHGMSYSEGEQMATAGAEGFIARMNAMLGQAQEIGHA